jgi:hypothetical protein
MPWIIQKLGIVSDLLSIWMLASLVILAFLWLARKRDDEPEDRAAQREAAWYGIWPTRR